MGTIVHRQASLGVPDHRRLHQPLYAGIFIREREIIHRRSYSGNHLWCYIRASRRQPLQSAHMGKHGSNHSGVLARRSCSPMLRRWCRTPKGVHGEALEIGGILARSCDDLWMAHHEPFHLVDDHTAELAGKPHVCCLRHSH